MLLAIDASTNWASLALLRDGLPLATHGWEIGQQHSTQLFGGIDALLVQAAASQADVTAMAVATGPGSFNGTRVAVTAAKTLAYVWHVPLVGVSTLDGIAEEVVREGAADRYNDGGHLLAVLEAGRDELYTRWYDLVRIDEARVGWHVHPRGPIAIAKVAEIITEAPVGNVTLCGEYSAAHGEALVAGFGKERLSLGEHQASQRALGLARLALLRLAAGEHDDPLALEPTYVRRPNITTSTRHPIPGAP